MTINKLYNLIKYLNDKAPNSQHANVHLLAEVHSGSVAPSAGADL